MPSSQRHNYCQQAERLLEKNSDKPLDSSFTVDIREYIQYLREPMPKVREGVTLKSEHLKREPEEGEYAIELIKDELYDDFVVWVYHFAPGEKPFWDT